MRGDAQEEVGVAQVPLGGMARGLQSLPYQLTGKPSPGQCCCREKPPRPILTSGQAGGPGPPRPHTHSPMAQHIPTLHQTSHSPASGITGEIEA